MAEIIKTVKIMIESFKFARVYSIRFFYRFRDSFDLRLIFSCRRRGRNTFEISKFYKTSWILKWKRSSLEIKLNCYRNVNCPYLLESFYSAKVSFIVEIIHAIGAVFKINTYQLLYWNCRWAVGCSHPCKQSTLTSSLPQDFGEQLLLVHHLKMLQNL